VSEFECVCVCVCVCVGMEQKPGNASNGVKLTPKDTASLQGHTFTHAHTHTHTQRQQIAAVHYLKENRSNTLNWMGHN